MFQHILDREQIRRVCYLYMKNKWPNNSRVILHFERRWRESAISSELVHYDILEYKHFDYTQKIGNNK